MIGDTIKYDRKADLSQSPPRSKREWALAYAGAGIPVFPCEEDGKAPDGQLAPEGCYSATTNPVQVDMWWTRKPNANIGGHLGPAGLAAIDLDCKPGQTRGIDTLRKLAPELAEAVDAGFAFVSITPSGGSHVLTRAEGIGSKNRVAPGIDVKSTGGYIVLPGSTTSAGSYRSRRRSQARSRR